MFVERIRDEISFKGEKQFAERVREDIIQAKNLLVNLKGNF
jgi:FAD synthase